MYAMTTLHFCFIVHDNTTLLGFGMIYLLQADLETDEVFAQMMLQPMNAVGYTQFELQIKPIIEHKGFGRVEKHILGIVIVRDKKNR